MGDPVMIAGAGPTGLTAALELSRLGIPVRITDKLPHPRTTSRAIGIQARTLELLAQRGLADELVRLGHKISGASPHGEGRRLTRLDLSRIPSPYTFTLLVPQSDTERVLGEAVARQGVTVERGVELVKAARTRRRRCARCSASPRGAGRSKRAVADQRRGRAQPHPDDA